MLQFCHQYRLDMYVLLHVAVVRNLSTRGRSKVAASVNFAYFSHSVNTRRDSLPAVSRVCAKDSFSAVAIG